MKNKIGKMERLRNSINKIRNEVVHETEVDELCEILNEDMDEIVSEDVDSEGIAASSVVRSKTLNKGQVSEAEVPRIY